MSTNQNHHPDDSFSLTGLRREVKQNIEAAKDVHSGLSLLVRGVFGLLLIAISAPAAMATPLLRHRMGFQALVVHGTLGLLLLAACAKVVSRGSMGTLIGLWVLALYVAVLVQFARSLWRMFRPIPGDHVHRQSLGEPRPFIHRLWFRLLGDRAMNGVKVALLGEAPLLIVIALLLFLVERLFVESRGVSVWVIPAMCGLGIAGQAGLQCIKQAYRRQVLLDREMDQNDLAESISEHGAAMDHRRPEGFCQIPR